MILEFEKFNGFKILKFFLFNSKAEIHLKELSRKLDTSPSSVNYYCNVFEEEEIIKSERKGNLRVLSLNDESAYVIELKKCFGLLHLKEQGIEKLIKNSGLLAVYGSYASGEFDEKSDVDILILAKESNVDKDFAAELEKNLGRQIQLTIIPYYKWEEMKKNKESFSQEVLKKHVVLKGGDL